MNSVNVGEAKQSIRVPRSCVVQTPYLLAEAMVKALGTNDTDTWLEPCVGKGMLLTALSNSGVNKSKIVGLDVDARPQTNDRFGKILRGEEFLRWSLSTKLRFSKVVANPPYIAIERLSASIRAAAIQASLSDEIKITANGNAWYAFLCAAIRLLKKDGSLCFLLPAAWDFANYAAPLRGAILQYFDNVEVYRTIAPIFRAEKVQEGAVVLLATKRRDPKYGVASRNIGSINRREVSSVEDLIVALSAHKTSKKSSAVESSKCVSAADFVRRPLEHQMLGAVLSISIGTVTGDSSYFLLTEAQRRELKLPVASVVPVLSRAKHLTSPHMTTKEWNLLKEADEKIWLFNPKKGITDNKFVRSYLRYGRRGGCNIENVKVAIRSPWFRFPRLVESDGFMSGMSAGMPWLSFRGMPKLGATNTLYVVNFVDQSLSQPQRLGVAMSMLTSCVRDQMRAKGRTYADGLLKYEPSDLLSLQIPKIGSVAASWKVYQRAVRALSDGDELACRKIADSCLP